MRKKFLQILIIGIMLLALIVTSFASCNKDDDIKPGNTPATDGASDTDDIKLNAPDDGGSAGLEYKRSVRIELSEKEVTLVFTNTERSTHNVTVQVVAEGTVSQVQSTAESISGLIVFLQLVESALTHWPSDLITSE